MSIAAASAARGAGWTWTNAWEYQRGGRMLASSCYSATVERCSAAGVTVPDAPTWWRFQRTMLVNQKAKLKAAIPYYVNTNLTGSDVAVYLYSDGSAPYPTNVPMMSVTGWCAYASLPTNYLDYTPWRCLNGLGPFTNTASEITATGRAYGWTNDSTAAGGAWLPAGRANWFTTDYGWQGLQDGAQELVWTRNAATPADLTNGYARYYFYGGWFWTNMICSSSGGGSRNWPYAWANSTGGARPTGLEDLPTFCGVLPIGVSSEPSGHLFPYPDWTNMITYEPRAWWPHGINLGMSGTIDENGGGNDYEVYVEGWDGPCFNDDKMIYSDNDDATFAVTNFVGVPHSSPDFYLDGWIKDVYNVGFVTRQLCFTSVEYVSAWIDSRRENAAIHTVTALPTNWNASAGLYVLGEWDDPTYGQTTNLNWTAEFVGLLNTNYFCLASTVTRSGTNTVASYEGFASTNAPFSGHTVFQEGWAVRNDALVPFWVVKWDVANGFDYK